MPRPLGPCGVPCRAGTAGLVPAATTCRICHGAPAGPARGGGRPGTGGQRHGLSTEAGGPENGRMIWLPLLWLPRGLLTSRAALVAENLALRQQLALLRRAAPRPRLRWRDRLFWSLLARCFAGRRSWLAIAQPETVLRWHRAGFRLSWRWRSGR